MDVEQTIMVSASPSPFVAGARAFRMPCGATVLDIVEQAGFEPDPETIHCWIDGEAVPAPMWRRVRPRAGHLVEVAAVPAGTYNESKAANLRSVLNIMTMAGGMAAGSAIGGFWGQAAMALISVAGYFLWNAIIPLPPTDALPSNQNLEGVSNPLEPYAVVPYTVGRFRLTPRQASRPYTTIEGDRQFMHLLFAMAKGRAQITSIRIGQTGIEQYNGVKWQVFMSDAIGESLFKNTVHELQVGAVAAAWKTITLDGGVDPLDVGEAMDGTIVPKLSDPVYPKVYDEIEQEWVDPGLYVVDYEAGTLTLGEAWPAGEARFTVKYWPAARAVTRVLPAPGEQISIEVDFLDGLYAEDKESSDTSESVDSQNPSVSLANFIAQYRLVGTSEAARVSYLPFTQRQDSEYFFGNSAALTLSRRNFDSVYCVVDMTGDKWESIKFLYLSPSRYVVYPMSGSINYLDENGDPANWPVPPWQYEPHDNEMQARQSRVFTVTHAPIDPDHEVKVEYVLLIPNPVPPYIPAFIQVWMEVDPDDYVVDYEAGTLTWGTEYGQWPIGMGLYRISYWGANPLTPRQYRWKVVYRWNPLEAAAQIFTADTTLLETALTALQGGVAMLEAVPEINRTATAIYKTQMQTILTRIMERVPSLDPSGVDPTLQALIDALVDLNGNSGGLGQLRLLIEGYGVVSEPEDSLIFQANDGCWHLAAAIDALVGIYRYIANEETTPTYRTPIYADVQKFCHMQVKLDPLFGEPYYEETNFNFRDNSKNLLRRSINWDVLTATYEASLKRMPGPANGDHYPWSPPADTDDTEFHTEATVGYMRALGTAMPVSEPDVTLLALRVEATDRLSGIIDDVSAIVGQYIPVWDPATHEWVVGLTRNPAWHFMWCLLGSSNARPIQAAWPVWSGGAFATDRFDMPSILEWADWCDENNWYVDYTFDSPTTVFSALKLICAAGRAAFQFSDGRYSVVIDRDQTNVIPAMLFTPRNVKGLEISMALVRRPHAMKCQFTDETVDYQENEVLACDDQYNETGESDLTIEELDGGAASLVLLWGPIDETQAVDSVVDLDDMSVVDPGLYTVNFTDSTIDLNSGTWGAGVARWRVTYWAARTEATEFEELDLPGCSTKFQAWRHGRWAMACARLRPRKITFQTDWANLRCKRGDLVLVQHYVMLTGLHAGARISELIWDDPDEPLHIVGCRVDDYWLMEAGKDYGIEVQFADGGIEVVAVQNTPGDSVDLLTFVDPDPESAGHTSIAVGDHVGYGEIGSITRECLVSEIKPLSNLGATLTCVDAAPAVLLADTAPIPAFDPGITEPPITVLYYPNPPTILDILTDERAMTVTGGTLTRNIAINLAPVDNTGSYEVPAFVHAQWRRTSSDDSGTWENLPEAAVSGTAQQIIVPAVTQLATYDVRVRYRSARFRCSDWVERDDVLVLGSTGNPPPTVRNFRIDGTVLRWDYPQPPIDHRGFMIRCIEGVDIENPENRWNNEWVIAQVWGLTYEWDLDNTFTGLNTFLIRAMDVSGLYSETSAVLELDATHPYLENIILEQDEKAGGWTGTIVDGEVSGGNLAASLSGEDLFWGAPDTDLFWPDAYDDAPFWNYLYGGLEYQFDVVISADKTSLWLDLNALSLSEQAHLTVSILLSGQTVEDPFVGKIQVGRGTHRITVLLWPDSDIAPPIGYATQTIIDRMTLFVDVPDVNESVLAVQITDAAAGVRLPILNTFSTIVTVQLSLLDGSDASSLVVVDKAILYGPGGGVGPLIKGFDIAGDPATATFDAFVRGY